MLPLHAFASSFTASKPELFSLAYCSSQIKAVLCCISSQSLGFNTRMAQNGPSYMLHLRLDQKTGIMYGCGKEHLTVESGGSLFPTEKPEFLHNELLKAFSFLAENRPFSRTLTLYSSGDSGFFTSSDCDSIQGSSAATLQCHSSGEKRKNIFFSATF